MKSLRAPFLVVACLAALTSSSMAVPVTNGSFENPGYMSGGVNNNPAFITGWTVSSPSYYGEQPLDGTEFDSLANSTGASYLWLNLDGPGSAFITSNNVLSIADNTTYNLTVALGDHNQTSGYADSGNMTLSLLANGVLIPGATQTVTNAQALAFKGTFEDFSVSFSTGSNDLLTGEELSIQLATSSGGQTQAGFDNVRLEASAAPEPSTYAMMLAGLGLLAFGLRFSKSRAA